MDREIISSGYDRVARSYAEQFYAELLHKPLDCALIDCFARQVDEDGIVADVGCGPGQIARALADRGLRARGIDLSPGMIAVAREAAPDLDFAVGSMFALDAADGAWSGITAFYAIVNLEREELPAVFRELRRVLRAGGLLLLSFHLGDQRVHVEELLGARVDLDFFFFPRALVEQELVAAGFAIDATIERAPYTAVEYPSRRCYILARAVDPSAA